MRTDFLSCVFSVFICAICEKLSIEPTRMHFAHHSAKNIYSNNFSLYFSACMKGPSHKLISYLLLCIAALPLMFAVYVQFSEGIIHRQMREELEQKTLVTIHVNAAQLIWTNKGKEATVNGNMFDVKDYTVNAGDILLTGLFDKDEDALFAQVNAQQKNNPDASGSSLALKWFSCFSWSLNAAATEFFLTEKSLPSSLLQNDIIQNPVLPCDTPPPESTLA